MVTATDVYGQASNNTASVTLLINAIAGPTAVVNAGSAGATPVPTNGAATLTNNGTACPRGGCTTYWDLACPGGRGSFVNRTGDAVTITVGASNGSADVFVAGAMAVFNCELAARNARGAMCRAWLWQHAHVMLAPSCARKGALLRPAPTSAACCSASYCPLH